MSRGRFRFDTSRAHVQLRSSTGRRALRDAVLMRLGSAIHIALVRRTSPLTQLELATNNENWVTTQAVRVVATLDIPDLIAAGVTELDDLATRVEVDRDALSRLSRHLVGRGIFVQTTPSSVGLTPVGELLRSGNPSGRHQYFQLTGITAAFRVGSRPDDVFHSHRGASLSACPWRGIVGAIGEGPAPHDLLRRPDDEPRQGDRSSPR